MDLTTGSVRAISVASDHENPVAIDYDPEESRFFWTDVHSKDIRSAKLDGSDDTRIISLSSG